MANKKSTLPASNPEQPTASQFYHFARERREPVRPLPPGSTAGMPGQAAPKASPRSEKKSRQIDIREELARRERIKNDDAEQDILLKRTTLNRLFRFLTAETVAIFLLAFLQGIHAPWGFRLEEWSFKILVTVTIAQITAMLFVAVRYLFPKK